MFLSPRKVDTRTGFSGVWYLEPIRADQKAQEGWYYTYADFFCKGPFKTREEAKKARKRHLIGSRVLT